MVDWNDDGLKDLLVGEYWGTVGYYRNIGTPGYPVLTSEGNLMVGGSELSVINNSCPCADDWSGDGLKDLLVGGSDGFVRLYINVGTNANPVFDETQYVTLANGAQLEVPGRAAPVVVDLDRDGLKDIVCGCTNGAAYFFKNTGTNSNPQLLEPIILGIDTLNIYAGATGRFAPIDWDGDGDLDLMAGSIESRLKLYKQGATTPYIPAIDLIYNGSWLIPTSGGTAEFTLTAENTTFSPVTFDFWTEARLPNGSYFGPLLLRLDLPLGPSSSISRDLSQNVPGTAPNGLYFYNAYAGGYDELQIFDTDHFFFHKMDIGRGDCISGWELYGWFDETEGQDPMARPAGLCLEISPNPFNEVTTINFELDQSDYIRILAYNSIGQEINTLVEDYRPKGKYALTWNGSGFPSGIYFISIQTETLQKVQKVVLLK